MANLMTLFRLFITFPSVLAVLKGEFYIALVLTALGALSDVVDGKVARWSGNAGGLGRFLDPYVDKVFILSLLIALVEAGRVSSVPVILIAFRDLSVSFLRTVTALQGTVLEASQIAKFKTFLLFLSLLLILAGADVGDEVLWVAVAVSYISAYDYLRSYLRSPSGLNYP
jgi:CDP-diacylglycerol--glycerol-3-phosphate 3-phosphatidyltransferase